MVVSMLAAPRIPSLENSKSLVHSSSVSLYAPVALNESESRRAMRANEFAGQERHLHCQRLIAMLLGVFILIGLHACSTERATNQVLPCGKSDASVKQTRSDSSSVSWPLCGVLTQKGYGESGSLSFVVPHDLRRQELTRYEVRDSTSDPAPLSVYAGWWLCVLRGAILSAPGSDSGRTGTYGAIEVFEYEIDQTNAERGQN